MGMSKCPTIVGASFWLTKSLTEQLGLEIILENRFGNKFLVSLDPSFEESS
jgi:hypothetical protein